MTDAEVDTPQVSGEHQPPWEWTEAEHGALCDNGGCPGYEYHRIVRRSDYFGSSEAPRD